MTYSTENIAIAGALKLCGHQIESIQVEGKRATFHFSESAAGDAMAIQMGTRLVDAIQFHQELRRLSGLAKTMSNRAQ